MTTACIKLNSLALKVNLGWPHDERVRQQTVSLDVTIYFMKPPLACENDQLDDTFCYDQLIQHIKAFVLDRKFRLLEHLGHELHHAIQSQFTTHTPIAICLTKKPPIPDLIGGVTFCYSDLEQAW